MIKAMELLFNRLEAYMIHSDGCTYGKRKWNYGTVDKEGSITRRGSYGILPCDCGLDQLRNKFRSK